MERHLVLCRSAAVVLSLFASVPASAQDTHYWNEQYGTRSTLLGGAVIGSVEDLGATFYNPGMIGLIDKPEFLLSARVYQYSSITVNDGAGQGLDLTSSSVRPAPSLVAGSFTFGWLGRHKLAYSLLTRQRIDIGLTFRGGGTKDVISSIPGAERYGAEFIGEQDMSDLWAGLTWSHPLGENMSIGATWYGAVRDQNSRRQFVGEALSDSGDVAISLDIVDYEYRHFRMLWKLGFGIDLDPLMLGVTVTTPSVGLTGSGKGLVNSAVSLPDTGYIASSYDDDARVEFKSPAAVGAGLRYRFENVTVHASAEYYGKIDRYDVVEIDPVTTSDGDTLRAALTEQLKGVVNWGVGLEYTTKGRWSAYGSFVADRSAAGSGRNDVNHSITTWDIYQVAGGGVLRLRRTEITVGAVYAFGSADARQQVNFDTADAANQLQGEAGVSNVDYKALKFVFGFSVDL